MTAGCTWPGLCRELRSPDKLDDKEKGFFAMFLIAEVALRVHDLERATAFYQECLGFMFHHSEPGVVFLEVGALDSPLGKIGHPQLLALFSRGRETDPTVSTFDHIAFEVPEDRFEEERDRFRDLKMITNERSWPDSLPWRGRSFFVRDPEGNVVELITANEG